MMKTMISLLLTLVPVFDHFKGIVLTNDPEYSAMLGVIWFFALVTFVYRVFCRQRA